MQLSYGDDGLDPVAMEAEEGKPLNLARSLSMVHATTPRPLRCPENAAEDGALRAPDQAIALCAPHCMDCGAIL